MAYNRPKHSHLETPQINHVPSWPHKSAEKNAMAHSRPILLMVTTAYLQITPTGIHHITCLTKIIDGEPKLSHGTLVEMWGAAPTIEMQERVSGTLGKITAHYKGWVEFEVVTKAPIYRLAVPTCKANLSYITRLQRLLAAHWMEDAYGPYQEEEGEQK